MKNSEEERQRVCREYSHRDEHEDVLRDEEGREYCCLSSPGVHLREEDLEMFLK